MGQELSKKFHSIEQTELQNQLLLSLERPPIFYAFRRRAGLFFFNFFCSWFGSRFFFYFFFIFFVHGLGHGLFFFFGGHSLFFCLVRGTIFSKIQYIYIFIPEHFMTHPSYWLRCENLICWSPVQFRDQSGSRCWSAETSVSNDDFTTTEK
jgi:hypothetical protein